VSAPKSELHWLLSFYFDLNFLSLELQQLAIEEVKSTRLIQLFFVEITVIVEWCGHGPGHVVTFAHDNAGSTRVRTAHQMDEFAIMVKGELHELPEGRDLCAHVGVAAEDRLAGCRVVAVDDPVVACCCLVKDCKLAVCPRQSLGV